jgi:hypothetical protein
MNAACSVSSSFGGAVVRVATGVPTAATAGIIYDGDVNQATHT